MVDLKVCSVCKCDKSVNEFDFYKGRFNKSCNDCKAKRLNSKCNHGQSKSKCRVCRGVGVCQHNTRKDICKICRGSQLCPCLKQKFECFKCNPADALFKRAGARMRGALGLDYMRGKRTIDILGCTKYEYFDYIQRLFTDGMNWERFNVDIEIDHTVAICYRENNIIPSIEDKIRRLHFSNTQPMYADENRRKGWRNL